MRSGKIRKKERKIKNEEKKRGGGDKNETVRQKNKQRMLKEL